MKKFFICLRRIKSINVLMTLTPKILIKALLKLDRNKKLLFGTQDIAK